MILNNIKYIIFLIVFYGLYIVGSYIIDCYWRPWAYNTHTDAQLFVGKWAGQFKDPNGVSKKINLEIFVPLTKADRLSNGVNCNGKAKRTKKSFDGFATVTSVLGVENYEIWGAFKDTDFQEFYFSSRVKQSLTVANFYLQETESNCTWKGDKMTIILPFYYQKANGSGFYSSEDPRFSEKATFVLNRQ